ncbi:hypothetical protein [Nostoc sp.]|uniref:hypothetical protein n=1 Tax=Nostoc sp. TaxID=1180 RepID=UPI002FF5A84B
MLTNIRLISVQEYHQMAETGIFHPEERLELSGTKSSKREVKAIAYAKSGIIDYWIFDVNGRKKNNN